VQLFPRHLGRQPPAAFAAVAAGGVVGATGRWVIAELWPAEAGQWPWATLIVNVVGSLAIGIAASRLVLHPLAAAFTVTGVLGGFTTYSSFAVELDHLLDAGRVGLALSYGAITIVAGLIAVSLTGSWIRPTGNDR
jgi:CrcB protein